MDIPLYRTQLTNASKLENYTRNNYKISFFPRTCFIFFKHIGKLTCSSNTALPWGTGYYLHAVLCKRITAASIQVKCWWASSTVSNPLGEGQGLQHHGEAARRCAEFMALLPPSLISGPDLGAMPNWWISAKFLRPPSLLQTKNVKNYFRVFSHWTAYQQVKLAFFNFGCRLIPVSQLWLKKCATLFVTADLLIWITICSCGTRRMWMEIWKFKKYFMFKKCLFVLFYPAR